MRLKAICSRLSKLQSKAESATATFAGRRMRVCVVIEFGGYPGTFEVGKKITGLEEAEKFRALRSFMRARLSMMMPILLPAGGCLELRHERRILRVP